MKWPIFKAKDLLSFKTGKLDSNAAVEDGIYPFFTCAQTTYKINTFAFDTECVLLAGNNAAGIFPLKYYNGKFNAYQRTYIIEPLDKISLNIKYIYFYFNLLLQSFEQQSTGATTKFLTIKILNNLNIILPPLEIQRKIAAMLSAYDELIEVNRQRIAALEQAAEELYREWFVRMRFPGYEHTPIEHGIPQGWEVVKVEHAFDYTAGGTPSKNIERFWKNGNINWYTPSDITSAQGIFLFESSDKCNEEGLASSSSKIFPAYSVMMTSRATIGAIGINTTDACTNQGFITCIPNKRYPLSFLYHWLKISKTFFETLCGGATFLELTKGVFKNINILTPSAQIMEMFERKNRPLIDAIEILLKQNQKLQTTRDQLLPKLMAGTLDLSDLELDYPPSMHHDL